VSDLAPLSFRQLVDRVPRMALPHLRTTLLPVALPLATAGVLLAVLQSRWSQSLTTATDPGELFGGMFVFFGGAMVVLAAYALGFSALQVASVDAVAGRPVNMTRAWLFTLRPPVLLTLLVVYFLGFVSLMMCFVPALYVVPVLSLVLPVMVEEDRRGIDAIRRSVGMAHSNPTGRLQDSGFAQLLALMVIGTVINYAISLVAQGPFVVIQQILVFRNAASGDPVSEAAVLSELLWLQVPAQIVGAFASVAVWLYWTFGLAMLYRELRRRREGGDLRRSIDELTGTGAAGPEADAAT
jgi:hypothetical protein